MEELDLTISDVVYRGKGLARHDGCVVFVPGVLPGETVRVEVTKRRKNYAEARLLEVREPAAARCAPACPLAGTCPGCCYQHMEHAEEARIKQAQLGNFLSRAGLLPDPAALAPATPAPAALGYRNKITLHADAGRLGYIAEDNRSVLDVAHCPLAVEAINTELARLRAGPDFLPSLKSGVEVCLRHTSTDGVIMHRSDRADTHGPWLTEQTGLGPIRVSSTGFFQVNPAVAADLLAHITGVLQRLQPAFVIDLYCGVGLFGLAAAKQGVGRVAGVDADPSSIQAARWNARNLKLSNAEFREASAAAGLARALKGAVPEQTAIVVDPPRQGLEPAVCEAVAGAGLRAVAYVSCAPDTLARDLARFREKGYRLTQARLLDMFPRTAGFESVVVLER